MPGSYMGLRPKRSYHSIFSDVCKIRFNNMVVRFFLVTVVIQAFVATLLSNSSSTFFIKPLKFAYKFILFYSIDILIIIARKNYLHVTSLGYSTFLTQVIGQLFSTKFVVYEITYTLCSLLFGITTYDDLRISSPKNGGSSIQESLITVFYRLHVWVLIPLLYTVQHVVFDLDKLPFSIYSQYSSPQSFVNSRIKGLMARSAILTGLLTFGIAPILMRLLVGKWFFSNWSAYWNLTLLSFLSLLNFEFINLSFNAHMCIGCLHKRKPISTLSQTPIETLINGLASSKPLTKLTAFQELSYRADSSDVALRTPIYKNSASGVNMWPGILRECLAVIKESNDSVNNYLYYVNNVLRHPQRGNRNNQYVASPVKKGGELETKDEVLFGTTTITGNDADSYYGGLQAKKASGNYYDMYDKDRHTNQEDNRRQNTITVKEEDVLLSGFKGERRRNTKNDKDRRGNGYGFSSRPVPLSYTDSKRSYNDSVIVDDTKLTLLIKSVMSTVKYKVFSFIFPNYLDATSVSVAFSSSSPSSKQQQQHLTILDLWCFSKARQAERLVPLSLCHAECVIALTEMLVKALDESPNSGVVASVGEVLKHLERSVAILGKYSEWDYEYGGNGVKRQENGEERSDVVSILYQLSAEAFLEIVAKYNVLLDDIHLDDDVVRLSKWFLEKCK